MRCRHCLSTNTVKRGKRRQRQQYRCGKCKRHFLERYLIRRMNPCRDAQLIRLHCGGMGTRAIAAEMGISHTCVMKTKLRLSAAVPEPELDPGRSYQVDEIATFVAWKKKPGRKPGKKNQKDEWYVAHAIDAKTGRHAGFACGKRTKKTLGGLTGRLLASGPKKIYTDGLPIYKYLIPKKLHTVFARCTNRIERLNLTLRTHIKRLNRKTLCFTRSRVMLDADLKLFFRARDLSFK